MDGSSQEWPTPNASLMNDGESPESFKARQEKWAGTYRNSMPLSVRATAWPTPIAGDAHLSSTPEAAQRRLQEGKETLSRVVDAQNWPTPRACDGSNPPMGVGRRSLPTEAMDTVRRWPRAPQSPAMPNAPQNLAQAAATEEWRSPKSRDFKGTTQDPQKVERHLEDGHQLNLNEQVIYLEKMKAPDNWPTPRTITGGAESAERKQELGRTESGGGDLQASAQNWPTPIGSDATGGETPEAWEERRKKKDAEGINLHYPLRVAAIEWPTPRAGNPGSRAPGTGGKVLSEEAKNWPTPTAMDTVNREGMRPSRAETNRATGYLSEEVVNWPTPTTEDNIQVTGDYADNPNHHSGTTLGGAASIWPTPAARDVKGENSHSPQDPMKIGDGSQTSSTQQWRTPTACTPNSLRGSGQDATKREAQGHAVNLQDQAHTRGGCDKRKRLNPCFVEWLMGMPHPFWSLPSCFAPIGSEHSETQ